ncbi:MAG: LysM domain-containing protein [Chloroflexales bacterium]|nr:LysM domain-containing protein [Chloroflexales bacterium]
MPESFQPNSRYRAVATAELVTPEGRTVVYLLRRFIPPPEVFALLHEREVGEGERVDTLAAAELGDPEQFWRIADANAALHPAELVAEVGRVLRITLPEGLQGPAQ